MRTLTRLAAILALTVSTAAPAVDLFTVNVPVDVKTLNAAATSIGVNCALNWRNPAASGMDQFGPLKFSTRYPLTGGSYTGPSPLTFVWRTEDFSAVDLPNVPIVLGGSCQLTIYAGSAGFVPR